MGGERHVRKHRKPGVQGMGLRSLGLAILPAFCAAILSAPLVAQQACDDPRRVVGGVDTEITVHPWQVALDIDGELCGGAIVAPQWVLTAAHCFDSDNPSKVRVKAGVTKYKTG